MADSLLHDVFPEALEESFSREEEAEALVKAVFQIAEQWNLTVDETRTLLGSPGRSRFYDLRKGSPSAVRGISEDEMDRLTYVTGIYYALGILFSENNSLLWLRNPAQPQDGHTRPWGSEAPLTHMLHGKIEGLIDVYRYVNGLRGGL